MRKIVLPFVFITIFAGFSHSMQKDSITWLQPNFPPYVIIEGYSKEKGIDNQIVAFIKKRLPKYEHRFESTSYAGVMARLKHEDQAIITPFFKTPEREEFTHYSEFPSYLCLPNGLAVKKADMNKFRPFLDERGHVNVEALVDKNNVSIGINEGRSYGGIIDKLIKKYADTGVFMSRGTSDLSYGVMRMLNKNRFDAAFGFPVEVTYSMNELGIRKDLFEVLPVSGMPRHLKVYFGAPKNEWGRKILSEINVLMKEKGVIEKFADYYRYWLDDAGKEYHVKLTKEYYPAGLLD